MNRYALKMHELDAHLLAPKMTGGIADGVMAKRMFICSMCTRWLCNLAL